MMPPTPRSALAVLLVLSLPAAMAQSSDEMTGDPNADATPGVTSLETVTVVGTRTERVLSDVPATISVINAEEVERQIARDIADLVRFEPGVSVGGTGSRFGLSGFTIRGIGGNRVLTTIDGIRVPEEFSFGPFLSARRDFVDIDGLDRAEIARGPISSLYGSDALGGVVALRTKRPSDYLDDGRPLHLGAKLGYSSVDESTVGTFTAAAGNDLVSGLVLYTRRDASETDNQGELDVIGPARGLADPQDISTDNVVAKLEVTPSDAHTLTLSLDYLDSTVLTEALSDLTDPDTVDPGNPFASVTQRRDADDTRERTRLSLAYAYVGDLVIADSLQATVYNQRSETIQATDEDRLSGGAFEVRTRRSTFEQEINGAFVQLAKSFAIGASNHDLIYGIDFFQTDSESLREGGAVDATGVPVPPSPFAPPLPTRDFPPTQVTQVAFFLQDEIALFDGRLLLSPGLRFDSFDADVSPDALFLDGNPGSPDPEDFSDEELTLRMGALYDFNETVSAYARYAEGFRAPPYDDVNVGFTNEAGFYRTLPNPDLESERSRGVELGLRFTGDIGAFTATWFRNQYDNFIESFAIAPEFAATGGFGPDGFLNFQSVNRERVEIDGVEFTAFLDLGAASDALSGMSFRASIAYADGEDTERNVPLNTIDPLTGVFGLGYESPNQRWGTDLILTLVDSKDAEEIDPTSGRLPTDSFAVLDLLARVNLTDRVSFNAGIFNLTDQTYLRWADTAAIGGAGGIGGADNPLRFSQPGINFGANFRVRY